MSHSSDWLELRFETPPFDAPTVSDALIGAGASGTWLLDGDRVTTVVAYFPATVPVTEVMGHVRTALPGLATLAEPAVQPVPAESWEKTWREQFQPIRIGDRWSVQAPWHQAPANLEIIEIEPGMAFGTGLHRTTRLCLEAMSDADLAGKTVFDVGTGSGVLSVAACKAGARRVYASDCDLLAVRSAVGNVARNGVTDRVRLLAARGLGGLRVHPEVVVANLTSAGVVELAGELAARPQWSGLLIASGIASQSAGSVESRLLHGGFDLVRRRAAEDWIALEAVYRPRNPG